jgi:hypothetical protein
MQQWPTCARDSWDCQQQFESRCRVLPACLPDCLLARHCHLSALEHVCCWRGGGWGVTGFSDRSQDSSIGALQQAVLPVFLPNAKRLGPFSWTVFHVVRELVAERPAQRCAHWALFLSKDTCSSRLCHLADTQLAKRSCSKACISSSRAVQANSAPSL